jgi:hypothetical protein
MIGSLRAGGSPATASPSWGPEPNRGISTRSPNIHKDVLSEKAFAHCKERGDAPDKRAYKGVYNRRGRVRRLGVLVIAVRSVLTIAVASAGFLLSGCAAQEAQQQRQAMVVAATQQYQADQAACQATFSDSNKDAIARAKCLGEADNKYAPFTRYPDLQHLLTAKRSELAERQAAGKITRAEMVLEYSKLSAELTTEEQRRDNDASTVAAQQQANNNAAALLMLQSIQANRPPPPPPPAPTINTSCQTLGTNTYCQTR